MSLSLHNLAVMQNVPYFIHADFCDLPNAEDSPLAPHDGLQYKFFDYDDSSIKYGLYLQWPEPLSEFYTH